MKTNPLFIILGLYNESGPTIILHSDRCPRCMEGVTGSVQVLKVEKEVTIECCAAVLYFKQR